MTTMLKWAPLTELDTMERRMRKMFEGLGFAPGILPATDVYETDDEFVVELEVPGFDEKELGIEVTDHTLTVKGERVDAKESEEKTYRLRERLERTFERRFHLPVEADTERVHATFGKGVLQVHAPRVELSKPKKVSIGRS